MAIVVKGATCSLGEAVIDKLLSMDIDVVATEKSHRLRNENLLKYSEYSGFAIIGAWPAASCIMSGAGVYPIWSIVLISDDITNTLCAWNAMKVFGGIKPSTATAAQPMSFKILFIPSILGISSMEIPVNLRPFI